MEQANKTDLPTVAAVSADPRFLALRAEIINRIKEDESWVLDFGEWVSVYRTWLTRQAHYRDEVQMKYGDEANKNLSLC